MNCYGEISGWEIVQLIVEHPELSEQLPWDDLNKRDWKFFFGYQAQFKIKRISKKYIQVLKPIQVQWQLKTKMRIPNYQLYV